MTVISNVFGISITAYTLRHQHQHHRIYTSATAAIPPQFGAGSASQRDVQSQLRRTAPLSSSVTIIIYILSSLSIHASCSQHNLEHFTDGGEARSYARQDDVVRAVVVC